MSNDKYRHIEDNQLLENFYSDKNNQWLGILLQRYTLLLLGVCMKYLKNEDEAKDAVQQVFLKAITELHKYKVDYFKSWLYTIAKNHCLMQLRSKGKYDIAINDDTITLTEEPELKLTLIEKDNTLNAMEVALQQLSTEQQQCITLFYLQKKSYQEITDITNYSLLQVKSYIQNGKRNLRILLLQQHQNEQ
ncbi:sigma-70 family RNA polymerase sigma factor [Ferruginibacter lapsinanis]|uniref:RNA polymerase sigma factor n=1 Tax=Ferruginibacter lapsinanis TaxID=563172 RepID=UPI001E49E792|nr:sigma-70 family RNA polymerase sigma factor [Ferruginibacter lapsinanis]UEG48692.1 sigma-70 family RNA polymerase sigma factor [Ferruginibacter lapsinanis]